MNWCAADESALAQLFPPITSRTTSGVLSLLRLGTEFKFFVERRLQDVAEVKTLAAQCWSSCCCKANAQARPGWPIWTIPSIQIKGRPKLNANYLSNEFLCIEGDSLHRYGLGTGGNRVSAAVDRKGAAGSGRMDREQDLPFRATQGLVSRIWVGNSEIKIFRQGKKTCAETFARH